MPQETTPPRGIQTGISESLLETKVLLNSAEQGVFFWIANNLVKHQIEGGEPLFDQAKRDEIIADFIEQLKTSGEFACFTEALDLLPQEKPRVLGKIAGVLRGKPSVELAVNLTVVTDDDNKRLNNVNAQALFKAIFYPLKVTITPQRGSLLGKSQGFGDRCNYKFNLVLAW